MKKDNKAKNFYLALLSAFIFLFVISFTSAFGFDEKQSMGVFGQGQADIIQTCDNCTYVNITSIYFPQEKRFLLKEETIMNKSGTLYNYTHNFINQTGTYVVTGHGDVDGVDTSWVATFQIGTDLSVGVFFILLLIPLIIAATGLYVKNEYFAILGGMALGFLAIFTFNNGITVYRSWVTDGFSLFIAALGLFFIAMGLDEALNF